MPVFKPIQLIPPGLLGLFQLKQEGRGIVEIPDVLQGVLELRDWYMQARAEWDQTAHGVTFSGGNVRSTFESFSPNAIAVPNREWWYVHQFNVEARMNPNTGTAELFQLTPMMVPDVVGVITPVALAGGFNSATAATFHVIVRAGGFFAPPAANLSFGIGAVITGDGTIDVNGEIRFTRLPS